MPPLLILGSRTRAAAESARRAGYEPIEVALDDDHGRVLRELADAPLNADVLLTNGAENHLQLVEAAALGRRVIGCGPESIRAARNPWNLAQLPPHRGLRYCAVDTPDSGVFHYLLFKLRHRKNVLLKALEGTDGRGISPWDRGAIPADHYVQQAAEGKPLAAVYFSDGWSAILLGVTEQLVGERFAGAARYQYCGSIYPFKLNERQRSAVGHLGVVLSQRHDLRGVFGVDLIVDKQGTLWPIEVNPRYTDSVEVIERTDQAAALLGRTGRPRDEAASTTYHAKLLLRVRQEAAPRLHAALTATLFKGIPKHQVADVPASGSVLSAGNHLCTLYTTASSRDRCVEQLRAMAGGINERLNGASAAAT